MGRAATTFFRRLVAMLSKERDVPYCKMIGWVCCHLSFALLRASIMSVRGARSSANRPTNGALHDPVKLQSAEGQLLAV